MRTVTSRRLGVIGLGAISQYYLHAVHELPNWELMAVCDVRAEALQPHRDNVPCFSEYVEMLDRARLDAVVVTAPNDAHASVCRAALERNVPVCVEKPLAIAIPDARALVRTARSTGQRLFTAFHRRYNDSVLSLLRQVRGRGVAAVRVRYCEEIEQHIGGDTWYLEPERCGGGCVADNGPNAFDLVRLFLGEVRVCNATVQHDEHGIDRWAQIGLSSTAGVPAEVELDWSYPGELKDVVVDLDDGTRLCADMLAEHPGFKASLWHEYVGVLADFGSAVGSAGWDDGGLAALELVTETYRTARCGTVVSERT